MNYEERIIELEMRCDKLEEMLCDQQELTLKRLTIIDENGKDAIVVGPSPLGVKLELKENAGLFHTENGNARISTGICQDGEAVTSFYSSTMKRRIAISMKPSGVAEYKLFDERDNQKPRFGISGFGDGRLIVSGFASGKPFFGFIAGADGESRLYSPAKKIDGLDDTADMVW